MNTRTTTTGGDALSATSTSTMTSLTSMTSALAVSLLLSMTACSETSSQNKGSQLAPPHLALPIPNASWEDINERWGEYEVELMRSIGIQKWHFIATLNLERVYFFYMDDFEIQKLDPVRVGLLMAHADEQHAIAILNFFSGKPEIFLRYLVD